MECRRARSSRATPRWPGSCPESPWGCAGRSTTRSPGRGRAAAPRETTSVTSPSRSAVSAVMRSSLPMSAQRRTSPSGTPRCNMPIGSSALTIPTLACGSKNTASSEQMMMSDSLRKYWAPPAHMPCTAVTTGFQTRWWIFGARSTPGSKLFQTLSFMNQSLPPFMSRPVQKARSPLAWSTTQWMSSVSRTVSQAHVMSSAIAWLNEFRLSGRFSVIVATLSATSNRMVSRSMVPPGPWPAARGQIVRSISRVAAGRAGQPASHDREATRAEEQIERNTPWRSRGRRPSSPVAHPAWPRPQPSCSARRAPTSRSSTCRPRPGPRWPRSSTARSTRSTSSTTNQVESAMADAVAALGGLHIAVNTAGGGIGEADAVQGRPAPARGLPPHHRAEPHRHLQPQPPAGVSHVDQRARGR